MAQAVAESHARWRAAHDDAALQIAVFGVYDAGKSSLIKRLLVELGVPIPAWLTISARPETNAATRVEAGSFAFVDTPGVASGNALHDDIAVDALALADAYLWVLPPQLLTSARETLVPIINGQRFHPLLHDSEVAPATMAAIARIDEAGIDPVENPPGFETRREDKRRELVELLQKGGISRPLAMVVTVAADPFQLVVDEPFPTRDDYADGRGWDGVEELLEQLQGLSEQRPALRRLAEVRFSAAIAHEVDQAMRHKLDEVATRAEEVDSEVKRVGLWRCQLDAVLAAARAHLDMSVQETLLEVGRTGQPDAFKATRELVERLQCSVDAWAVQSTIELSQVAKIIDNEADAKEFQFDVRAHVPKPAAREEGRDAAVSESTVRKTGRRIRDIASTIGFTYQRHLESSLGMSASMAAENLKKIEKLDGDALKSTIEKVFKGQQGVEKAGQLVSFSQALEVFGPIASQLSEVAIDLVVAGMNAAEAKRKHEARREARNQLRAAGIDLCEKAYGTWMHAAVPLSEHLVARDAELIRQRDLLLAEEDAIKRFRASLDERVSGMIAAHRSFV